MRRRHTLSIQHLRLLARPYTPFRSFPCLSKDVGLAPRACFDPALTSLLSVFIIRPRFDYDRTLGCYGRSIEGSLRAPSTTAWNTEFSPRHFRFGVLGACMARPAEDANGMADLKGRAVSRRATRATAASFQLRRARVSLQDGDVASAIATLTAAAKVTAGNAEVWLDLGWAWLRRDGAESQALAAFRRAAALAPNRPAAWRGRAQALRRRGDLRGAVDALETALELAPGDPETWTEMATVLEELGYAREGIEACRAAVEQGVDLSRAWVQFGDARVTAHDLGGALAAYGEALRLRADDFSLHFNCGWVQAQLGAYEAAIASYRIALQLRPSDARTWYNLGNVLMQHRDFQGARRALRRAAAISGADPEVWNNLGNAALACRSALEAERAYRRAIALDPAFHPAWNNLGNVHEQAGRPQAADTCYGRALALGPGQPIYLLNRALVRAQLGLQAEALDDLEVAVAANPLLAEAATEIPAFRSLRTLPRFRRLLGPSSAARRRRK